jgi:hypothetical protein
MSVACGTVAVSLLPCRRHLTLYARSVPNAVCVAPPEDEEVMLETCRDSRFSINWMKSASSWFYYTNILWCTVRKTLGMPETCLQILCLFAYNLTLHTKQFLCCELVFLLHPCVPRQYSCIVRRLRARNPLRLGLCTQHNRFPTNSDNRN